MAEEEPAIVDSVTEATNGIGSEALAAITNLGGGSGQAASSVLSRLGATISGQAGGFAPKVITTVTRHGLAAIDRVEPIQGLDENRRFSSANQKPPISDDVDRGYRAVARDANGLETIRTVLDLDPREYDVTVTREDGVAIVEFVQQEPESEAALPPGEEDDEAETTASDSAEPTTTVEETGNADRRGQAPAPKRAETQASTHVQPAVETTAPAAHDEEVQRARVKSEKAKAQAEAEKARAEAEKARAEAEAAKARAEAEQAKAEVDVEAARRGSADATQPLETGSAGEPAGQQAPTDASESPSERRAAAAEPQTDSQFSASRATDAGFDPDSGDGAADGTADGTAGTWRLSDSNGEAGRESATGADGDDTAASDESVSDSADGDEFGGFTPATPVEDELPEYADGGTIETEISVYDGGSTQNAVADGGTEADESETAEDTGKFQF